MTLKKIHPVTFWQVNIFWFVAYRFAVVCSILRDIYIDSGVFVSCHRPLDFQLA